MVGSRYTKLNNLVKKSRVFEAKDFVRIIKTGMDVHARPRMILVMPNHVIKNKKNLELLLRTARYILLYLFNVKNV